MNQLSLFNIDAEGNMVLERPKETFVKPCLETKYQKMISELDEYQIQVVEAEADASMYCIAGAGAGKTRTLISRAIKLVLKDNVDPTSIVLITFTNKAANELKERYIHFFKDQHPENCTFPIPHISTIHSFCLSQIRRTFGFNRTILSEYHSYKLFKEICQKICLQEEGFTLEIKVINALYKIYQGLQSSLEILPLCCPVFNTDGTLNRVVENYSEAKELDSSLLKKLPYFRLQALLSGKEPEQGFSEVIRSYLYSTPIREGVFRKICIEFLSEKYKNKTLDFTDMDFQYLLLMAQYPELRSIVHNNYQHIMQDESQDSSPAQFLTCVFADKESFEDFYKK